MGVFMCQWCALLPQIRAMADLILNLPALFIAEWIRDPKYHSGLLVLPFESSVGFLVESDTLNLPSSSLRCSLQYPNIGKGDPVYT